MGPVPCRNGIKTMLRGCPRRIRLSQKPAMRRSDRQSERDPCVHEWGQQPPQRLGESPVNYLWSDGTWPRAAFEANVAFRWTRSLGSAQT